MRTGKLVWLMAATWTIACGGGSEGPALLEPGPEAQRQILEALIGASPGEVIELGAGRFELDTTLSLDVPGVTLRGQGIDQTVLDFSGQVPGSGGEGLLVTADDFTVEDLTVEGTRGDGIKVQGTRGVTFRRVEVDWPGPVATENGAYGLYPVQCEDVLIEESRVRGASDAGIYVGQSRNIIVRNNKAFLNVAGIEIENSQNADVYGNEVYSNAGGLLVFSLPELPVKDGCCTRVWNNDIHDNNHENFGKPGAIVSALPPGSGLIVMANDRVEVFDNLFRGNDTANISVVSFLTTQRGYDDPEYDPYPEGIWIHHNTFEGGGANPQGDFAEALRPLLGERLPDIVFDGIVDAAKTVDGELPPELRLYLNDNGEATFANADMTRILAGAEPKIDTDPALYAGALPDPPGAVVIEGVEVPQAPSYPPPALPAAEASDEADAGDAALEP